MRRNYMSPEFINNRVNGTLSMLEESNFFSARMLEIEESILIDNIDLLWYQNQNKEQIDISIESSLLPYVYSPSQDKIQNLSLKIDPNDTTIGQRRNTRWIFEINVQKILINYLYATLKKFRTFEGVKNGQTVYNDIDVAIINYIKINILNRYKFKQIDLYLVNRDINQEGLIKSKNIWNSNLSNDFLTKNYQTIINSDESVVKLLLLQLNSNEYIFEYYYNILFERI
jgi:hypothetical protein